ncbi:hypothetical protein FXO38_26027 [Capsicum annuum]|nr:hypothetical protein FXO38_26027 [Capsicum annuum]
MIDVYNETDGYNEDNEDVLNTKLVDENIGEEQILESQFTFSDEVLKSIDLDFRKKNPILKLKMSSSIIEHPSANKAQPMPMHVSRIRRPSRYKESSFTMNFGSAYDCNLMNIVRRVFDMYKVDDASLNDGGKEYHLNEYISEFCMHAIVSWHTVDHMFIPVHNKGIDIDNHPNYKLNDKTDPFGVSVVENVPQQPSGSLDCGLYMVTYDECLTFGEGVPSIDFDPDLIHIRNALLLWDYGTRKAELKAQSDDKAPMRPLREIELIEGTEVHDI